MATDGLPRLAVRHWYITLVGLVITVALCGGAYKAVPATFEAKADVLLLPAQKSVGTGGNPYLELGGIQQAAEVLASAMSDSTATDAVQSGGGSGSYSVVIDPRTSAPLLLITSKGRTASITLDTLQAVINIADPTLVRLQQAINVPSGYLITTKVVTVDDVASKVRKSQIRAVIAAGAAGIVLTLLAIALLSRVIARRRARRRASQPDRPTLSSSRPPAVELLPGQQPTGLIGGSGEASRQGPIGGLGREAPGRASQEETTPPGVLGPLRRG